MNFNNDPLGALDFNLGCDTEYHPLKLRHGLGFDN